MCLSKRRWKQAIFTILLLGIVNLGLILYETGFYHEIEFHPIPQHELAVPSLDAH